MNKGLLPSCLLCISFGAFAQLDNRIFEDRMILQEADSGKLHAGIRLLGFGKNNEYFDTIIEGYTLLGYQLQPYLSYQLGANVRLDAGAYFQKDFGTSDYATIAPTLSLKVKSGDFNFVFGNLESSLNHRLIEPLYDFERLMNNRLESGVQLQWIRDGLFLDVWVDWQNMIYNRDTGQEKFMSGFSLNKRLTNTSWKISLPLQATLGHHGGQINFNPPPLETHYNVAAGVEANKEGGGWIEMWTMNGFYVYYKNVSSVLARPYSDGEGVYLNANAKTTSGLDVMLSYWQGNEYLSVQGGKIYASVSAFDYTVQREEMQWVMLRLLYHRKIIEGLQGSLRFEPYYDLGFQSLQYSYGLYLQFNDRFFLAERKRK